MREALRSAIGIMGDAASLLLYTAPIMVIRKRSTEEFSWIPYIFALLNCLIYTWYGLPVVSLGWENFPLATINGLGVLLETSFVFIYMLFSMAGRKKLVSFMVLTVIVLFFMTIFISIFAICEHKHRKMFLGTIGLVASITMYGSPLVSVKQVIKTKSVEFMPFYLSLFSFLGSSLWLVYGLLGQDIFVEAPNFIGSPMGIFQLVLYAIYRKGKGLNGEDDQTVDIEKN